MLNLFSRKEAISYTIFNKYKDSKLYSKLHYNEFKYYNKGHIFISDISL